MNSPADARKPRGRPRALEPRTTVCTWLQASDHDRLIRLANQREQSVSAVVRQILKVQLSE
jgi:hypothetical protein